MEIHILGAVPIGVMVLFYTLGFGALMALVKYRYKIDRIQVIN